MSKPILVRQSAIRRLRDNFHIWHDLTGMEVILKIKELVENGIAIGGQLSDGIAFEAALPTGETVILVGKLLADCCEIVTVVTREQYAVHAVTFGLRGPEHKPTKHKFNRRSRRSAERKLRSNRPWKFGIDQ